MHKRPHCTPDSIHANPHSFITLAWYQNVLNAILCAVVLLPSAIVVYHLYASCETKVADTFGGRFWSFFFDSSPSPYNRAPFLVPGEWCKVAVNQPFVFANALFFFNVTVGFWLIGLLQRSFWLIDPYWTIIPPLLGHLYQYHPKAQSDPYRSALVLGLLWIWSLRLTHSYFRREEWKFGQREDWRYAKMAADYPKLWPLLSFFAVGLAQQPMLLGISAPALAAHTDATPFGLADVLCALGCVTGLAVARLADNQLAAYMACTPRPTPLLNTGVWRYSRHPNYFGEQLFWWSFSAFAVRLGQPIWVLGTAFNSLILATVTFMTEERMLTRWSKERVELYREYIRTTSPCIPWFPRASKVLPVSAAGEGQEGAARASASATPKGKKTPKRQSKAL